MKQAAPSGAKRRGLRRWGRWFAVFCLLVPLGFGLSNLCLTSPWGRAWLATKIRQRSGMEAHMGGVTWSPWNGFTLREITVVQGTGFRSTHAQPLICIGSLRLVPVWRSFLHGHFDLRDVVIESPRFHLSIEMLADLARQQAVPTLPPIAAQPAIPPIAAQSAIPPVAALQADQQSPPQVSSSPPGGGPAPQASDMQPSTPPPGKSASTSPPVQTPAAPRVGVPQAPLWIRLRHASLEIVREGGEVPLVEITDLTSDLPVHGDAAKSMLSVGRLKVNGMTVLSDFHAPLAWQSPVLTLPMVEVIIEGTRVQFAGQIAMLKHLPLRMDVRLPKQAPAPIGFPGGGVVKAGQIVVNGQFRGLLLAPGSWQADLLAWASAISIRQEEHHAAFDRGDCVIVLRGGMLSCVDARALSDELSLLGNATLLADGRAAGVLRLVASPETTMGIIRRLFPDMRSEPALTPMSTPQRVAFDLGAFGYLKDLQLQLGQYGPIVPLK